MMLTGGLDRARTRRRVAALGATLLVGGLTLVGCTPDGPVDTEPTANITTTPAPPSVDPDATAPPTPRPTLDPHGDVAQAKAVFDDVNIHTVKSNPEARGEDFISALIAAGFQAEDMQLTADKTSVGLDAGSIQFSVLWGESCLIGQNGEGSDGYQSEVAPVLPTGNCLIGKTVAIDVG